MNLYHWKSNTLAEYGRGDIIVMAKSETDACEIARDQLEVRFNNEDWLDEEDREEIRSAFDQDLSSDPAIVESGCILIRGSE